MAMDLTREDIAEAALLFIADDAGVFRWSSDRSPIEVHAFLRAAARQVAAEIGLLTCRVCGCSAWSACTPPCSWQSPGLCSSHPPAPKGFRP